MPSARHIFLLLLVGAFGAVGCGPDRDTDGESYELQALEQRCGSAHGFTGGELLRRLDQSYTAPLYYPEGGELSNVDLGIDYRQGAIHCIPGGDDRAARLDVGVRLEIASDDGAFRESIPGTVSGYSDSRQFRFSGRIPYDERNGTIAKEGIDGAVAELMVEGWIETEENLTQGAIRILDSGSEGPEWPTVATWDEGPHPLEKDDRPCTGRAGLTPEAFRLALGSTHTAPLRVDGRRGHSMARVTVSYADKAVLCEPSGGEGNRPALAAEVRVALHATDGTLVETLMGHARMSSDSTISFRAEGPATPTEELSYAADLLEEGRSYRPRVEGLLNLAEGTVRGELVAEPARASDRMESTRLATWGDRH